MKRYMVLLLLAFLTSVAMGQHRYVREPNFLNIPGLSELNDEWFVQESDSHSFGFLHPMAIELVRLNPANFRVIIVDVAPPHFTHFRIRAGQRLRLTDLAFSGNEPDAEDPTLEPIAICQVKAGTYFNPAANYFAALSADTNLLSVYHFDSNNGILIFDHYIQSDHLTKPTKICWAAGTYFVADETQQAIIRLDSLGNYLGSYGGNGISSSKYRWITDMKAFTDEAGVAHLYVTDGRNYRLDHLTATRMSPTIELHSQSWCLDSSGYFLHPHSLAILRPDGIVVHDRWQNTLMCWPTLDSLQLANRFDVAVTDLIGDNELFWLREVAGRLLLFSFDAEGNAHLKTFSLSSSGLDDFGSAFEDPLPEAPLPTEYALHQNFPNPFNPNTEIHFDLPESVPVQIRVYNIYGQLVTTLVDEVRPAGTFQVRWNGRSSSETNVGSGVYIYQIRAGNFIDAKKMLLIK